MGSLDEHIHLFTIHRSPCDREKGKCLTILYHLNLFLWIQRWIRHRWDQTLHVLFFGIVIVVERRPSFQINQSKKASCMVRIVHFLNLDHSWSMYLQFSRPKIIFFELIPGLHFLHLKLKAGSSYHHSFAWGSTCMTNANVDLPWREKI